MQSRGKCIWDFTASTMRRDDAMRMRWEGAKACARGPYPRSSTGWAGIGVGLALHAHCPSRFFFLYPRRRHAYHTLLLHACMCRNHIMRGSAAKRDAFLSSPVMGSWQATPGFPIPRGQGYRAQGYRAPMVSTVANHTKPCKIYQDFKLFFKFKKIIVVFLLPYSAVSAVTVQLPAVLQTLGYTRWKPLDAAVLFFLLVIELEQV